MKHIISLLLISVLLICVSGCGGAAVEEPEPERFTLSDKQNLAPDRKAYILTDNETGNQYLVYEYYKGAGITGIEQKQEPTRYGITADERYLIEQVVMAESGGEVYAGQLAVAECILNACEKDGIRPHEAVREYQYSPDRPEPSESVREAVAAVFDNGDSVFGESKPIYFYAPKFGKSEFHERQKFICEIGGHKFYEEAEK